ncbi:unknown [Clostridium sp. CAG:780]|nr:unknown [Clostridium sp. CAG:780]
MDTSLPSLTVVGEKGKNSSAVLIKLKVATADKYTKFEKAYIMYNNEKIEVTSEITGNTYISAFDIAVSLMTGGKINDKYVLENTDQTIILVKDNKEYTGTINMGDFPTIQ